MLKRNKLQFLTLSTLLLSTSAYSMRFSATINKLKLPVLMSTEQPPQIKYLAPGNINVTAKRMCGDGDVSQFSSSNPKFDFVPSEEAKLDVIVGYWIVEEGSLDINPNNSNWYPIAYKPVDIASSDSNLNQNGGRFLPFNHAPIGANVNGLTIIRSELVNLYKIAKESFQSSKNYRVYASALACVTPDESSEMVPEGTGSYAPSPVETINSLSSITNAAESALSGSVINVIINNNKKIKIDPKTATVATSDPANPKPYSFSFGNQGIDLESSNLYTLFKSIMNTEYPEAAKDVDEYKTALANIKSSISGYTNDKIKFCNDVGAVSNKTAKTYTYEPFPMNLTCKNLYSDSALDIAYKALFQPAEKPSVEEFLVVKKNLAKRFLVAAGYEVSQKHLADKPVIRTGCFKKAGQNLIGRIVASYPFKFQFDSVNKRYALKTNPNNHLHPEYLFAISDYYRYFANDVLAIWGQVQQAQGTTNISDIQSQNSIALPLSNRDELEAKPVDNTSFGGVPLNINFKVRSVGGNCNGTIYC